MCYLPRASAADVVALFNSVCGQAPRRRRERGLHAHVALSAACASRGTDGPPDPSPSLERPRVRARAHRTRTPVERDHGAAARRVLVARSGCEVHGWRVRSGCEVHGWRARSGVHGRGLGATRPRGRTGASRRCVHAPDAAVARPGWRVGAGWGGAGGNCKDWRGARGQVSGRASLSPDRQRQAGGGGGGDRGRRVQRLARLTRGRRAASFMPSRQRPKHGLAGRGLRCKTAGGRVAPSLADWLGPAGMSRVTTV